MTDKNLIKPFTDDVLVVAARPDGFERVFIGEKRWHAVRVNPAAMNVIRYLAPYISAPISAITHYAPVDRITMWEKGPRFCVYLAGPPVRLVRPIHITPGGKLRSIQDRRYTTLPLLLAATTLDEVFANKGVTTDTPA